MQAVADLSAGTQLRAGTAGWTYTVQGCDDDRVVLSGPRGSIGVSHDDLQRDIARGNVVVIS
jgi:hypothetical protein